MDRMGRLGILILGLSLMAGWGLSAEAAPKWRVEDRSFHARDRVWQAREKSPEALWHKRDRLFFRSDGVWRSKEDRAFGIRDRAWMKEEQSL